ncbi:TPA: hypothetical protein ACX96Z_004118 [Clostridium sporogenes]
MKIDCVLKNHGIGSDKVRRGYKLPASILSPPTIPITPQSSIRMYPSTTSSASTFYDEFSNNIIISTYYNSSSAIVCIADKDSLAIKKTIQIPSDNSGNNPSTQLLNVRFYDEESKILYTNFYTYQNLTTPRYIRTFTEEGKLITQINNAQITTILKRTNEYVVYFNSVTSAIEKIKFSDGNVTILSNLKEKHSINNLIVSLVDNWDKVIVHENYNYSKSTCKCFLYDLEGNFLDKVFTLDLSLKTWFGTSSMSNLVYHKKSNSIISIFCGSQKYSGHYWNRYSVEDLSLIESKCMSTNSSDFTTTNEKNLIVYDKSINHLLASLQNRTGPSTFLFPLKLNGDIKGWDYANSEYNSDDSRNEFSKYVSRKSGGYQTNVKNGIIFTENDYFKRIQSYYEVGGRV